MRKVTLIILILFVSKIIFAQKDSLIIKLDDFGQMIIVSQNLVKNKLDTLYLSQIFESFFEDFSKFNHPDYGDNDYIIRYKKSKYEENNRKIVIASSNNKSDQYFLQKDKKGSINSYKYSFELPANNKTIISIDSLIHLKKLSGFNLDALYLQSMSDIQKQDLNKRKKYLFFYSTKNKRIDLDSRFIYSNKSQDFIMLYPTFGMQLINNTFVPEITANLDVILSFKEETGQKFGLSSTLMFFPNENNYFHLNTYYFVHANYHLRLNEKWSHLIGVGYLYARNGDHFSDNTWNLFWQTSANKIGIKLGGYATKNIEGNYTTLPSIGFDFGF